MKHLALLAAAALLLTLPARGGEIFGTLSDGDKAIPAGVRVEISAGGKSYTGETDKFGGYRIFVKEKGKCSLKIYYKEQTPAVEVVSFEKSMRYDLVLENQKGTYVIHRK